MAFKYFDRVKETSTTTGTGTITLAGAVSGYRTFTSVFSNSDTMYYCIADQVGANWETGVGTFTTSGTTLARTTVIASSNSGSAVSFSTPVYVFNTVSASFFPVNTRTGLTFSGCRCYNTTNQTISHATWTSITFNTEDFDTDNYHSTSSNTSRIVGPTAG